MERVKVKTPLGFDPRDLFRFKPGDLFNPSDDLFNTTKSFVSWKDDYPFNTPVQEGAMPVELQQELIDTLRSLFPENLKIEVWSEGNSVRFKIRKEFNKSFWGGAVDYPYLNNVRGVLSNIREGINNQNKKFKRCKVFYLDYEKEPEMNSVNVVFNPAWKRYENYEILFRSNTQLRRKRGV